jgi:hypothetical protein
MLPSNFTTLMRRDQVTAATARAVAALYDELWHQAPPESSHREKITASRARNYARARGWALPGAWDDDWIDDPAAVPADGWERCGSGELKAAALAAEAEELAGYGLTPELAAERLGVKRATLEQAVARARRAAAIQAEAGEAA